MSRRNSEKDVPFTTTSAFLFSLYFVGLDLVIVSLNRPGFEKLVMGLLCLAVGVVLIGAFLIVRAPSRVGDATSKLFAATHVMEPLVPTFLLPEPAEEFYRKRRRLRERLDTWEQRQNLASLKRLGETLREQTEGGGNGERPPSPGISDLAERIDNLHSESLGEVEEAERREVRRIVREAEEHHRRTMTSGIQHLVRSRGPEKVGPVVLVSSSSLPFLGVWGLWRAWSSLPSRRFLLGTLLTLSAAFLLAFVDEPLDVLVPD